MLRYLTRIQTDQNLRHVWWFIYLHQAKDIKARTCFYFLGIIRMTAERVKMIKHRKDRSAFITKLQDSIDEAEKQIIAQEELTAEELDGEFLFGVENHILKKMREDLRKKDQALQEKDQALQEKDLALQEKDQALQEKDQLIRKLQDELLHAKK